MSEPFIQDGRVRYRIGQHEADLLVRILILLNDQPRFAPKDRRLHYDSYSLASEITDTLKRNGWNWQMLSNQLPRE